MVKTCIAGTKESGAVPYTETIVACYVCFYEVGRVNKKFFSLNDKVEQNRNVIIEKMMDSLNSRYCDGDGYA